MSNAIIDFEKLVGNTTKKLFAGRANGQEAYNFFRLNDFGKSNTDRLYIKIPAGVVVSSSYFLGMLEKIIPKYARPSDLFKVTLLDGVEYQEGMLTEFDRAVKRGLRKNAPLF